MSARQNLLARQRAWAEAAANSVDDRGSLPTVEANLFRPLSGSALADFAHGSGSELVDARPRPAKMRALHSSSALAVNVFDFWQGRDAGPLLQALGIDGQLKSLRFEAQYPTGLGGMPPNLDVALELADGRVIVIESKFSEWLTPKPASRKPFSPSYFPAGDGVWARRGLPACQALAEAIAGGAQPFVQLDAGQLLKHALGLATHLPDRFGLKYVFFDQPGPESQRHADELERFAERLDPALAFRAYRYQDLIGAPVFASHAPAYAAYLADRYL